MLLRRVPGFNGLCGPYDGDQCPSCLRYQQAEERAGLDWDVRGPRPRVATNRWREGWEARRMLLSERTQLFKHYCAQNLEPPLHRTASTEQLRPSEQLLPHKKDVKQAFRAVIVRYLGNNALFTCMLTVCCHTLQKPPAKSRHEERAAWALARRARRPAVADKLQAAADHLSNICGDYIKVLFSMHAV